MSTEALVSLDEYLGGCAAGFACTALVHANSIKTLRLLHPDVTNKIPGIVLDRDIPDILIIPLLGGILVNLSQLMENPDDYDKVFRFIEDIEHALIQLVQGTLKPNEIGDLMFKCVSFYLLVARLAKTKQHCTTYTGGAGVLFLTALDIPVLKVLYGMIDKLLQIIRGINNPDDFSIEPEDKQYLVRGWPVIKINMSMISAKISDSGFKLNHITPPELLI